MSVLDVYSMDCSLRTWPSITQFDEIMWTGLGDLDRLETLEQMDISLDGDTDCADSADFKARPSSFTPMENQKTLPSSDAIFGSNTQPMIYGGFSPAPSLESPSFFSSDSLEPTRWQSINATDLASVLDNAFPCESASPVPGMEDAYPLYDSDLLMRPEQGLSGEVEFFMTNPTSHSLAATMPSAVALTDIDSASGDSSSLASNQIQSDNWNVTADVVDGERLATSGTSVEAVRDTLPQTSVPSSIPSLEEDRLLELDSSPLLNIKSEADVQQIEPTDHCPLSCTVAGSMDHAVCNTQSQPACMQQPRNQLDTKLQRWQQTTSQIPQDHSAVKSAKTIMIGSTQEISDMKVNRAKASRARRLAASQRRAEGRAKKYPLRKLIRMSSASHTSRDRLGNSLATLVPILHTPVQMVPQNLSNLPGGVQSFQMNPLSQQTTYVPVVIPAAPVTSGQPSLSYPVLNSNPVQADSKFTIQPQQMQSHCEGQSFTSESSVVQFPSVQQPVDPLLNPSNVMSQSTALPSGQLLDAAVLKQLETVVKKLNEQTRFCIRDSLYRLANSAKERQKRAEFFGSNFGTKILDPKTSCTDASMETQTNPIDRWVVSLLFCIPSTAPEANRQTCSNISRGDTSQLMFQTSNTTDHWNTCGSLVNLHNQPLHMLTG